MVNFSSIDISNPSRKAFEKLYTYWSGLRDGINIPNKSQFNPMKIKSILPEIGIMERIDDNTMTYRLAGTELNERGGMEMTGINTIDTFPVEVRDVINGAYKKSAAQPCGAYHQVIMSYTMDSSYQIDCLYLPLSDDHGVAKYHILLMFVGDKQKYKEVSIHKFTGYEVPAIEYFDIGFGAPERDEVPSHVARLPKA